MKVNYNISAIIANNTLALNDRNLTASTERLSSGYKINHGKDNPAGLAMAKRMNSQIRGLSQASQSASDGISIVETAEGALAEVHDMLQRMNELAIKAATGTLSDGDRTMLQEEADQLKSEIMRIAETTEFNGKNLLGGDCDLKGYSTDASINVKYYSDEVNAGPYKIHITKAEFDENGDIDPDTLQIELIEGRFPENAVITAKDNKITIKDDNTFVLKLELTSDVDDKDIGLNLTGIGAMRLQIGANEGQVLDIRIPKISLDDMGIQELDLRTQDGGTRGIDQVAEAIEYVSSVRSRLGAYQNRLEHSVSSLDITHENMTGAYSRLMDVDMSTEMIEYTKNQVLVQSSTSMLAQANERPSQVLQLLQ